MNAKRDFEDYAGFIVRQLSQPAPADPVMITVDETRIVRLHDQMQKALKRMSPEEREEAVEWFAQELAARVAVERAPEWLMARLGDRRAS